VALAEEGRVPGFVEEAVGLFQWWRGVRAHLGAILLVPIWDWMSLSKSASISKTLVGLLEELVGHGWWGLAVWPVSNRSAGGQGGRAKGRLKVSRRGRLPTDWYLCTCAVHDEKSGHDAPGRQELHQENKGENRPILTLATLLRELVPGFRLASRG
jgi:hypothetical protein